MKEPQVIKVKRPKSSPLQKLYQTKKFKAEWAEFEETYAAGKFIGRRDGIKEGERRELMALAKAYKLVGRPAADSWIDSWIKTRL